MNIQSLQDRLWQNPKRVVFTDGLNPSVLQAARQLSDKGWAKPIVVGSPLQIHELAEQHKLRLHGVSVKKPLHDPNFDAYGRFYRKQVEKELSYRDAREKLQQPLYYAALLVKHGQADLIIAPTEEHLDELLQTERIFSEEKPCVSASAVIWDESSEAVFVFADVLINARPDAQKLARIAADSASTFSKLSGQPAKVAMLSFSTMGSAEHPRVQTVRDAVRILRDEHPELNVEGELQFDAALVPEIQKKKAPQSSLGGSANVFVFSSLNAADPGFKIVQSLTSFNTAGPFLQGLQTPVQWLQPDEGAEQIIKQVIIASNLLNA